ncbi:hypothetical protein RAHE111665_17780 [Rariglobus hedericola]
MVSPVCLSQIEILKRAFDLPMTKFKKLHPNLSNPLFSNNLPFSSAKRSKG